MLSEQEKLKLLEIASKPKKRSSKSKNLKASEKLKNVVGFDEKQNKNYKRLALQIGGMVVKNTNIVASRVRKTENLPNKADLKKVSGGFDKIHSERYLKNILSLSNQFIKYCVRNENIKELRDIRPRMVEEFCKEKMETKEWNFRTLETMVGYFKKIGESGSKNGLKKFNKLVTSNTEGLKKEFRPTGTRKENRVRNRKSDGSSLSVREGRIISKHMQKNWGVIGKAAVDFLVESGVRKDEFMHIRWADIDFEKGSVDLTRKNLNKNGRERITTGISPKTMALLKEIKEVLNIKNNNQTVFRHTFGSADTFTSAVKQSARDGKVGYLGLHAFRSASKEYQTKQLHKIKEKMIREHGNKEGKRLYKEHLAQNIMNHVRFSDKLNPVVDENGNKRRFNEEKMRNQRVDTLERLLISQNYGHNRTSVLNYYG